MELSREDKRDVAYFKIPKVLLLAKINIGKLILGGLCNILVNHYYDKTKPSRQDIREDLDSLGKSIDLLCQDSVKILDIDIINYRFFDFNKNLNKVLTKICENLGVHKIKVDIGEYIENLSDFDKQLLKDLFTNERLVIAFKRKKEPTIIRDPRIPNGYMMVDRFNNLNINIHDQDLPF